MDPTNIRPEEVPPRFKAEPALQTLLDAYAGRQCSVEQLTTALTAHCMEQPAATWQALSLLDQYYRRGVLSIALFRSIKIELNAIAFGTTGKHTAVLSNPQTQRTSQLDATLSHAFSAQTSQNSLDAPETAYRTIASQAGEAWQPTQTQHFESHDEMPQPQDALWQDEIFTEFFTDTSLDTLDVDPAAVTRCDSTRQHDAQAVDIESQPLTIAQAALQHSPSLRPGTQLLNRYVLIEPLTSGGIGLVFKALDLQRAALPESERYVAIKCVHESLQDEPRAIAALRHEFSQAQVVSHPNIAKVYDFHQGDGLNFLVLELLAGESLSRICERIAPRRLPTARALTIVREIGHAIAHAHDRGVLHGNLQPNNVVITPDGNVRVREFGQATAWLETATAQVHDGLPEIKPSSPELRYRSPQQQRAIPADAADDIYSLACIAFELLCGHAPDAGAAHAGANTPDYARHLSAAQWQTLQRGLNEDRAQRGNDVRQWLVGLDLRHAEVRLPSLSVLEVQFAGDNKLRFPTWMTASAIGVAAILASVGIVYLWPGAQPLTSTSSATPTASRTSEATDTISTAEPVPPPASEAESRVNAAESLANAPGPTTNVSSPTVGFTQHSYDIPANRAIATLTIERTGPIDKPITLEWFTIEGTAKSDFDYGHDKNARVYMQPQQRTAQVNIPLIKGPPRDRVAWFDVRIRATTDAMPGDAVAATVYLLPASGTESR